MLFLPALLPGRALFWGTPLLQFVPWRAWAWETLRAGHLPLWNPLSGMGAPLIANYQSGLFYPPNWLYFGLAALGGMPALAWGQGWLAAAHLAWAGVGMALLVRRMGLGQFSQAIGGLAFGLSGYLVARAGFLSINAAVAWMPWVLLALTPRQILSENRCVDYPKERAKDFLLLALSTGMLLLAGHAQVAWYSLILAVGWSAAMAWLRGAENGQKARIAFAWLRLGLGLAAGALLAAVQLLPTAEYLLESQRAAAVDYGLAMTYSFWPWRLLTLAAPGLFGSPASGDYHGYGNYWEDAIYIGLLPLLLAIAALSSAAGATQYRRQADPTNRYSGTARRLAGFLAGLILAAFLLALGKNTPIFPWLYRHAPTFALFQAPSRFTLWAVYGLAMLAALGAQAWRRPLGRGLYWTRLGTAGAAAICLAAGAAWLAAGGIAAEGSPSSSTAIYGFSSAAARAMSLAGAFGIAAGMLALTAPQRDQEGAGQNTQGWWQWAVILSVALDLIVAGWGLNPAARLEIYRRTAPGNEQLREVAGGGRLYLPPDDDRELRYERFFRFETFNAVRDWTQVRAVLLPNTNMLEGLASANNFDPLLPGRYARWMEKLAEAPENHQQAMLNLMAVSLVENLDESRPNGVNFTPQPALPRLRWFPCALYAEDGESALKLTLTSLEQQGTLVVEGGPVAQPAGCRQADSGSVWLVRENPNQIEARTQAGAPGYLLLVDTWYPGWQAWIDGHPAPVWRANYLFRAVPLPEGEHQVIIAYRPVWFFLGAVLSGLACLGLIAAFIWIYRGEKPVV